MKKNVESRLDKGLLFDSFKHFMQFSPDQKFQQATLAFMVHHLLENSEVKELRNIFIQFDTNKDGKLTHSEVLKGFKSSLDIIQNEKEFMKVIKKVDQDKSGYIEYEGIISL